MVRLSLRGTIDIQLPHFIPYQKPSVTSFIWHSQLSKAPTYCAFVVAAQPLIRLSDDAIIRPRLLMQCRPDLLRGSYVLSFQSNSYYLSKNSQNKKNHVYPCQHSSEPSGPDQSTSCLPPQCISGDIPSRENHLPGLSPEKAHQTDDPTSSSDFGRLPCHNFVTKIHFRLVVFHFLSGAGLGFHTSRSSIPCC